VHTVSQAEKCHSSGGAAGIKGSVAECAGFKDALGLHEHMKFGGLIFCLAWAYSCNSIVDAVVSHSSLFMLSVFSKHFIMVT
jgi:hypothetical protein